MIESNPSSVNLESMIRAESQPRFVADLHLANQATIGQLLLSLTVGGGEVLATRIARRLGDRFRFVFFCLDELGTLGEELRREGFSVHVLGRRAGIDWRCATRLARLFRRERISLVHAHQYTPFFYAASARRMAGNVPVVFTEHGRTFPDYRRWKRVLANRVLLGRRDRVVGVGAAVRQALIDNEGLAPNRVEVIYNGIDLSPFRIERRAARDDVRRDLRCAPESLVIIQVARLDPLKDHLTALRAFQQVRVQRPDARLILVGEGPERQTIEAEVAKRELTPWVHLVGLRKDVPRWLAAADVFWLTSVSEGIPLTVIEAMAAGVPVVATNVGGVGEIVESEETGLLVPVENDRALADAVLRLAANHEFARRLSESGRLRAFDRFSEDQMHAGYTQVYDQLLHD